MRKTEAPANGESCRQQLLPSPTAGAPLLDSTDILVHGDPFRGHRSLFMADPVVQYGFDTSPILRIKTSLHIPPKTRIGPIGGSADIPMFHGVVVNVLYVLPVVPLIPDGVFPIAGLPDRASLSDAMATGEDLMLRYPCLDQPPPRRIAVIAGRQGPDAVEVIRQYDHRIDDKRPCLVHAQNSLTQDVDGLAVPEKGMSSGGDDCEEVDAAWYEGTSVVHGRGGSASDYASLIRPTGLGAILVPDMKGATGSVAPVWYKTRQDPEHRLRCCRDRRPASLTGWPCRNPPFAAKRPWRRPGASGRRWCCC